MSNVPAEPSSDRQGPGGGARTAVATDTQASMIPAQAAPPRALGSEAIELETPQGRTVIADGVVAKIASVAAREIDGVHDLVPLGAGAAIAGFAGRLAKADQRATGVSVEVGKREAAVDLNMTVDYGVNIPQVADAVRQNVMDRIREMTGLIVKEVNINAADLYFPEDQAAQARVQ